MLVLGLPDTPPQNMPIIVAEANQTQGNGAWNAPYMAFKDSNVVAFVLGEGYRSFRVTLTWRSRAGMPSLLAHPTG